MCHSVTFVDLTTAYKREVFYINYVNTADISTTNGLNNKNVWRIR